MKISEFKMSELMTVEPLSCNDITEYVKQNDNEYQFPLQQIFATIEINIDRNSLNFETENAKEQFEHILKLWKEKAESLKLEIVNN